MATIKDVARLAGVSTATVSYVINKSRFVSDELAQKVLKAIEDLDYTPSKIAQSLRRGKTSIIGLVMDDITNRFASQFTYGLEIGAAKRGYNIIFSDLQKKVENEERSINMLLDHWVDGLIYAGYGNVEEQLVELYTNGFPVVAVDKPLQTERLPSVLIDNRTGIVKALSYLWRQGHRCILYINGLPINRNGLCRADAFATFFRDHNLPLDGDSIIYGDYTLEHGYQSTLRVLDEHRRFTALMCGDDIIAFGAIAALKSRGVSIPDDVAVVGFDDDPIAKIFDPSLTTIRYPMYEMGRRSFDVLYRMIAKKRKKPEHILLDTELVIRHSTDSDHRV